MSRMVREYVEIRDVSSIDALIAKLSAVRHSLPNARDAQIRMRGDDVFGRMLSISYMRPQTPEEAALDARYALPVQTPPDELPTVKLRIVH